MKYTVETNQFGAIYWCKEGTNILHREDGPAREHPSGYKEYWINSQLHREDGPAIVYVDGTKEYWVNGKRHREDGPAIEYADGCKEYFINGKQLTEKEFNNRNKVFTKEQLKKMSIEELHQLIS